MLCLYQEVRSKGTARRRQSQPAEKVMGGRKEGPGERQGMPCVYHEVRAKGVARRGHSRLV